MRKVPYILLALLITSCASMRSANHHLKRAKHHLKMAEVKGAKLNADTVFMTKEVIVPERRIDTLLQTVNFRDTITVTQDKVITRVKIDTVNKSVYIESVCLPDTIKLEVPFIVNKEITTAKTFSQILGFLIIALIIGVIFGLYAGRKLNFIMCHRPSKTHRNLSNRPSSFR